MSDAIKSHEFYQGKIGTQLKSPIKGREELSLGHTPGKANVSRELAAHPHRTRMLGLKSNTVAVASDGSAVLGLGNIGAYEAIPVREGKGVFIGISNVLAFSGIFRGTFNHGVRKITNDLLLHAAENLTEVIPNPLPENTVLSTLMHAPVWQCRRQYGKSDILKKY